jgi:RNA polymerase sigma-70 factor, ECF subfamily
MAELRVPDIRKELPSLLPRLWRFAIVQCRDPDFAQDLVQATCIRAIERAAQFVPGTHFDRWTFSILASIWKNEIEKRRVRSGNGIVEADTLASNDYLETMELTTTIKQILGVITALPDQQRMIAMLVYVEGFTFQQASEALDVPLSTLLSRMVVVRAKLAQRFAPTSANLEQRGRQK